MKFRAPNRLAGPLRRSNRYSWGRREWRFVLASPLPDSVRQVRKETPPLPIIGIAGNTNLFAIAVLVEPTNLTRVIIRPLYASSVVQFDLIHGLIPFRCFLPGFLFPGRFIVARFSVPSSLFLHVWYRYRRTNGRRYLTLASDRTATYGNGASHTPDRFPPQTRRRTNRSSRAETRMWS